MRLFGRYRKRTWPKFGENSTIKKTAEIKNWVEIEDPVHIGPYCNISARSIGRYTFINAHCSIFGSVTIGRFSSIAQRCQVGGAEHQLDYVSTSSFRLQRHWFRDDPLAQSAELLPTPEYNGGRRSRETLIGHDVWLGASSIVLKGVTIGDGAVIGAGAVVTKDVPPYAIVVGNPAQIIRFRFPPEIIARFMAAEWWNKDPELIARLPLADVEQTLKILEET